MKPTKVKFYKKDGTPVHFKIMKSKINPLQPSKEECKHEPTGDWEVRDGKSYATCKKCGEYETTLIQPKEAVEYRCECFGWVENFENNGPLKRLDFFYCPYCGNKLKSKKSEPSKEEYIRGNCPFCDSEHGFSDSWGLSPAGWEQIREEHKNHGHLPSKKEPADEIRKIWEEMKELKREREKSNIDYPLEAKYEEIETLFGRESTLSKAIIYYLDKQYEK